MYFLVALACTIVAALLWFFFRDRKGLHLDILTITFGASTLMWLVDCFYTLFEDGVFISFAAEDIVKDGWVALWTIIGGLFFWMLLSFILNNKKKAIAKEQ